MYTWAFKKAFENIPEYILNCREIKWNGGTMNGIGGKWVCIKGSKMEKKLETGVWQNTLKLPSACWTCPGSWGNAVQWCLLRKVRGQWNENRPCVDWDFPAPFLSFCSQTLLSFSLLIIWRVRKLWGNNTDTNITLIRISETLIKAKQFQFSQSQLVGQMFQTENLL